MKVASTTSDNRPCMITKGGQLAAQRLSFGYGNPAHGDSAIMSSEGCLEENCGKTKAVLFEVAVGP